MKGIKGEKLTFNERCYELLKKVPKGQVTTYKALAQAMNTRAYRAVGNAMNKNPYAFAARAGAVGSSSAEQNALVPCHRVINSNGELGGFATGVKNKIRMLKKEGVKIIDGRINLSEYEYSF